MRIVNCRVEQLLNVSECKENARMDTVASSIVWKKMISEDVSLSFSSANGGSTSDVKQFGMSDLPKSSCRGLSRL